MTVSSKMNISDELNYGRHGVVRLLSFFASQQEEIKYVPNPGNAGDALIALATILSFKKLGVKFSLHGPKTVFSDNDTVVYGGGGNLVPMYQDASSCIKNNLHVQRLVLLPHTIAGNVELLQSLGRNTFIFARERISFRHIVSNMNYPENCFIDHDLAFSLNCSAIETSVKLGHLNAFREDCERTGIVIPVGNVDLSRKYTLPGCTFIWKNIIASVSGLVSAISSASSISTNRLHIAILASLLNKQTKFYGNSYYKNQAVFEYSIAHRFPQTSFMSTNEF